MNRISINVFDFYDDFYKFTWNIISTLKTVYSTSDGMIDYKNSVVLDDNSTSGRVVIGTFNPLLRDNDVRPPPAYEIDLLAKSSVNYEFEQSIIYNGSGNYHDFPFSLGATNEWRHARITYLFTNQKTGSVLRVTKIFANYNSILLSYNRGFQQHAFASYANLTTNIVCFTYYGSTGKLYVDLIAYRQIHLTDPPQHRPNAKVYAHVHNGRGKEVGVTSVGGVM